MMLPIRTIVLAGATAALLAACASNERLHKTNVDQVSSAKSFPSATKARIDFVNDSGELVHVF